MSRSKSFVIIGILIAILIAVAMIFGWFSQEEQPPKVGEGTVTQPEENMPEEQEEVKEEIEEEPPIVDSKDQETKNQTGVFVGDVAPDFHLLDKEGNEINLSDLKDKVVIVNFWTTWKTSCLPQLRAMQEAYENYKDQQVIILGINVLAADSMDKEEIHQFLEDNGFTFPVLFDEEGSTTAAYKISTFPTTYLIDGKGVIREVVTEAMEKDTLVQKIENILEP